MIQPDSYVINIKFDKFLAVERKAIFNIKILELKNSIINVSENETYLNN